MWVYFRSMRARDWDRGEENRDYRAWSVRYGVLFRLIYFKEVF